MALSPIYIHSPGARRSSADAYTNAAAAFLAGSPPPALYSPPDSQTYAPKNPSTGTSIDYRTLLDTDPILGQANTNIAAAGIQNKANLTAARRAALAQFGIVPEGLGGDLAADIDETTRQLAQQATAGGVSTIARLQKAYDQDRQGRVASVAARGLLRSGATGQHLSEALSDFNIANFDARSRLLDYLNGLWQGFQREQQQLQGQGLEAQNSALLRLIEQIKAGLVTGGSTVAPPTAPPTSNPAEIAAAPLLTLPSRTQEPKTFPAQTLLRPGVAYAA